MGLITYPVVIVKAQDYSHVKVKTVPDQSMSLQEIIRRFTRKESLPIEKEGTYETRFGDLEKIGNMDLTEQSEKIADIKEAVGKYEKRYKAKKAAESAAAAAASLPPPSDPVKTE